jgi:hypothetical protein
MGVGAAVHEDQLAGATGLAMQPRPYLTLLSLVMVGCVVISCAPKTQQFSFDLKGHSVFKNNTEEDTALSPEEQRCIRRRFALLHQLGGKY